MPAVSKAQSLKLLAHEVQVVSVNRDGWQGRATDQRLVNCNRPPVLWEADGRLWGWASVLQRLVARGTLSGARGLTDCCGGCRLSRCRPNRA
jgi:hypothetical protein